MATVNRRNIEGAVIMFVRQYLRSIDVDPSRIGDKELLSRIQRTFKTMPESDSRKEKK